MIDRLVVATSNADKLAEIRGILGGAGVEILSLASWPDLVPPGETGATFAENARAKALFYAEATGLAVVAEDSGLEIDALGGAPGVLSARFGGEATSYPRKFDLLYSMLRDRSVTGTTARFVCALALARGQAIIFEARGVVEGQLASRPRGESGFGYDPIFLYPPFGRTLAEISRAEKATVSHRGQAFRALAQYLKESGASTQDSGARIQDSDDTGDRVNV
jgi:XTP/dITP diphosphohydrolase